MLVGQDRLKEHFVDLITHDSLPKLIILTGERGQGKYTLARYIADKVGDIYEPENLKVDDIRKIVEDSQSLSRKRIYILKDADEMTIQAQNALLKIAEEPAENAYIILTIEHENNILPTIKSRGSMYHLEPYTVEQLKEFTDDAILLKMFSNIGQIKKAQEVDINKLINTTQTVIENIKKVSAANVFNIKKHFDGFENDLIISSFLYEYSERLKKDQDKRSILEQMKVIYKYKNQLKNKSINKDNSLEIMFVELREKALLERR